MRQVRSGLLCLTLALSALAAVVFFSPGLAAAVGLDLWNVPAAIDAMGQAAELDRRLDDKLLATQLHSALKDEVTEDVVAGRLTLAEAASRFRAFDAYAPEEYRRGWVATARGAPDEERYCRQVLDYAEVALRDRADGPAVLAGLKRQLEEALAHGDLRLPE